MLIWETTLSLQRRDLFLLQEWRAGDHVIRRTGDQGACMWCLMPCMVTCNGKYWSACYLMNVFLSLSLPHVCLQKTSVLKVGPAFSILIHLFTSTFIPNVLYQCYMSAAWMVGRYHFVAEFIMEIMQLFNKIQVKWGKNKQTKKHQKSSHHLKIYLHLLWDYAKFLYYYSRH